MSKMFPFVTKTWNPVDGDCIYDCSYCWAKSLIKRHGFTRYEGKGRLNEKSMKKMPSPHFGTVFVQDMSDISILRSEDTKTLMKQIETKNGVCNYLLLTKNPTWYHKMIQYGVVFPDNVILGATIETNRPILVSKAPTPIERLGAMYLLSTSLKNNLFISIEPIMEFDRDVLLPNISIIRPWGVAVGYDNYNNGLPEPSLAKTTEFIDSLEKRGIRVYRKTLREKTQ